MTVAVGNNGERDRELGYSRVQVPSDCVNALAVGAADDTGADWARAPYSAIGPGRSPRADQLITRMRGARTYSELLSVEGLDSQALGCLLSYMTLYSQRARPIAALAPAQVRSLVGLREERRSEINDEGDIANVAVVRVISSVMDGRKRARTLIMEALLTGQAKIAFRTLEWLWVRDDFIHIKSRPSAS